MITDSLILRVDSYKLSHYLQFPPKTQGMFSYIESRGGKFNSTVFFGLQYFIKKYLLKPITAEMVNEAEDFAKAHGLPFPADGWKRIRLIHGGYLPVRIKAVPEGSVIPTHNVLVTIESTDPQLFWLVSWLETALLRAIWYPVSVATLSYHSKKLILKYLGITS